MLIIRNDVRKGTYLDSVALMRMSRAVAAMDGVAECGMMMATPANKRIMADAGVLGPEGEAAGPGDLVIAVSARDATTADAGMAAARAAIDAPKARTGDAAAWTPRSIRAAVAADPAANVALISVPGAFAAGEARKALARGLNVMMFSDNVSIADEVALKRDAAARGLLMMGPDCGTAIINGVPLAFANVVPRGDIGIIGASGTGIQEVSCLIANNGGGISHAIGTGGRDLKADVGAITTLMAIDLLEADNATRHIVIISKPPAEAVAATVLQRVGRSKKTFTVCFIGSRGAAVPDNARLVSTLKAAAEHALGKAIPAMAAVTPTSAGVASRVRGLYAGGTLCAEAQHVFLQAGRTPHSNVPIPGAHASATAGDAHLLLDLGDDEFTQGRPHPMIEPAVRDEPLLAALRDPSVGVILLDIVLGMGGHLDPAGHLQRFLATALPALARTPPKLVASITGTAGDPQDLRGQQAKLATVALVCPSNADAAAAALALADGGR